jgi:hypothetical protein
MVHKDSLEILRHVFLQMCQNVKTKPKIMRHRCWLISFAVNQMCWTHCNNSETLGRPRNTRNEVFGLSLYFCVNTIFHISLSIKR